MWQRTQMEQEFRKRGKRVTRQRMVIFEVISGKEWSSCKEVCCEVSRKDSTIGMATVYRTIRTLEEIGLLRYGYQHAVPGGEAAKIPEKGERVLS